VIGTQIAGLLREHPELGLVPQGFLGGAARPAGTGGGDAGPGRGEPASDIPVADTATPVLGQLDDLTEVVGRHRISRVIVSFSGHDQDLVPVLRACRRLRADVCVVPRLYELGAAVPRACLDEVWGIPLIPLRRYGQPPSLLLKRAFDVLASTLLLAVAGPLLLMLALAVRLRCGPPALFRQVRVTGHGRLATIMKLRTLSEISDPDTSWVAATGQCTPLGRLLRATHLDELPQLVNVLRGDMSLVGPRPERPVFAGRFSREIPRYRDRNRMPAGMTGWAQIHGLNGDTSIRDRARFDNQYIEYWSFWLDLVILFRTFATTVAAATHRPSGSRHTSGSRIVHASGSAPPEAATSLPGSTQGDQK